MKCKYCDTAMVERWGMTYPPVLMSRSCHNSLCPKNMHDGEPKKILTSYLKDILKCPNGHQLRYFGYIDPSLECEVKTCEFYNLNIFLDDLELYGAD